MLSTSEGLLRVLTLLESPRDWSGPYPPQRISTIETACRDAEGLGMDSRKHDGTESTRSVEPYRMVHLGRRWYLVAWDRDRRAWRTFRVDRLQLRSPNGPRFTPRELPAKDIGEDGMGNVRSGPYTYHAHGVGTAPAAVLPQPVPRASVVEAIDHPKC